WHRADARGAGAVDRPAARRHLYTPRQLVLLLSPGDVAPPERDPHADVLVDRSPVRLLLGALALLVASPAAAVASGMIRVALVESARAADIRGFDIDVTPLGVGCPRWPAEALRAQAIVARTYAAYQRSVAGGKPYQILATTAHQLFAGRVSPTSPSWNAVQDTAGQVLRWEGELFPAFYHSESGGYTE